MALSRLAQPMTLALRYMERLLQVLDPRKGQKKIVREHVRAAAIMQWTSRTHVCSTTTPVATKMQRIRAVYVRAWFRSCGDQTGQSASTNKIPGVKHVRLAC